MRKLCDKCLKFFDVGDEYVGYNVICPNCGMETMIKAETKTRAKTQQPCRTQECEVNLNLCLFLGLAFNLIGLLIAAIIGRQKGCVYGLYGMLIADVIGLVIWLAATLI